MPPDHVEITVHLPEALAERLEELSEQLGRSRDWIVAQALGEWIDREDERDRLTLEALADVDAGRVVEHDAVQAWLDSLATDSPLPPPQP